ncbi:hypothetical protein EV175_006871, partial [Coemansia sp. RSA 1933]
LEEAPEATVPMVALPIEKVLEPSDLASDVAEQPLADKPIEDETTHAPVSSIDATADADPVEEPEPSSSADPVELDTSVSTEEKSVEMEEPIVEKPREAVPVAEDLSTVPLSGDKQEDTPDPLADQPSAELDVPVEDSGKDGVSDAASDYVVVEPSNIESPADEPESVSSPEDVVETLDTEDIPVEVPAAATFTTAEPVVGMFAPEPTQEGIQDIAVSTVADSAVADDLIAPTATEDLSNEPVAEEPVAVPSTADLVAAIPSVEEVAVADGSP